MYDDKHSKVIVMHDDYELKKRPCYYWQSMQGENLIVVKFYDWISELE